MYNSLNDTHIFQNQKEELEWRIAWEFWRGFFLAKADEYPKLKEIKIREEKKK